MNQFNLKIFFCFLLKNLLVCGSSAIDSTSISLADIIKIRRCFQSAEISPENLKDIISRELQDLEDIEEFNPDFDNEDIHLNIIELIRKYGYKVEVHHVTTKDGYILTLHRIPGRGPPVLLMHGLLCSSDDYVTAGPDGALAYFLASEGYDVWMGNARGNKHSKKHERLSPDSAEFWDFSWDEIGRFDLPAIIDYVLDSTGQVKLNYIGWSQGTTSVFVLCSELPEYNKKISLIIALAPVAWMSHLKSPIPRFLASANECYYTILKSLGIHEVLPDNVILRVLKNLVCGDKPLDKFVCNNILISFVGYGGGKLNTTNLPVILGHNPSGSSVKQIVHYGQEIESGRFCKFDHDKDNIEVYGSPVPPEYPVERISAPVALIYSDSDWFSNVTDVSILRNKLPNVVDFHLIDKYTHIDFMWATDLKEFLNPKLLRLIKAYF